MDFSQAIENNDSSAVQTQEFTPEGFKTALESGKVLGGQGADRGFIESDSFAEQPPTPQPSPAPQSMETAQQDASAQQGANIGAQQNEELEKLKRELEQAKEYVQFGKQVESDPELFNHFQSFYEKKNTPPEPEPLERPEIPEDPYDKDAMRSYNEKLLEYNEKLAERKAQEISSRQVQSLQEQLQAERQALQQQQMLNEQMQKVQQQYQADPQELEDFKRWASDRNNLNMESVFQLYRIANGKMPSGQNPQSAQLQQQRLAQAQANSNLPQPLGQVTSAGATSAPSVIDLIKGAGKPANGGLYE